jgi:hypothetical protein
MSARRPYRPDAQALADASLTPEAAFQVRVLELAERLGYELRYHTHDSRRSEAGFPDLVLVRPRDHRLVFLELKAGKKQATEAQLRWLRQLNEVPGVDAAVARDGSNWTDIEAWLR